MLSRAALKDVCEFYLCSDWKNLPCFFLYPVYFSNPNIEARDKESHADYSIKLK
jgi:hypothetical protein